MVGIWPSFRSGFLSGEELEIKSVILASFHAELILARYLAIGEEELSTSRVLLPEALGRLNFRFIQHFNCK